MRVWVPGPTHLQLDSNGFGCVRFQLTVHAAHDVLVSHAAQNRTGAAQGQDTCERVADACQAAMAYATLRSKPRTTSPRDTAGGSNWAPASLNVAAMTVATVVNRSHAAHSIMAVHGCGDASTCHWLSSTLEPTNAMSPPLQQRSQRPWDRLASERGEVEGQLHGQGNRSMIVPWVFNVIKFQTPHRGDIDDVTCVCRIEGTTPTDSTHSVRDRRRGTPPSITPRIERVRRPASTS
jgi:hypothetical protein